METSVVTLHKRRGDPDFNYLDPEALGTRLVIQLLVDDYNSSAIQKTEWCNFSFWYTPALIYLFLVGDLISDLWMNKEMIEIDACLKEGCS